MGSMQAVSIDNRRVHWLRGKEHVWWMGQARQQGRSRRCLGFKLCCLWSNLAYFWVSKECGKKTIC